MIDDVRSGIDVEVIDDIVPEHIRKDLWEVCQSPNWYFGYLPGGTDNSEPFWRMDLEDNEVVNTFWYHAKPKCEELVGKSLTVLRQYANGHTFGLGGQTHRDGSNAGCYTLLYYPMQEWSPDWDGETVFYKGGEGSDKAQSTSWDGFERTRIVRPLPNRGVLFDARLPHEGRAPSRRCNSLRVTVALKLKEI